MSYSADQLPELLQNRPLVFLGAGSQIRGDDGWVFHLFRDLQTDAASEVLFLWGETTPENYIPVIVKKNPATVMICDAGIMNEKPGTVRIFEIHELNEDDIYLSHRMSLSALAKEIQHKARCNVFVLLMQPASIEFSLSLSPGVDEATRQLAALIRAGLSAGRDKKQLTSE